jgi:hypothetical protein
MRLSRIALLVAATAASILVAVRTGLIDVPRRYDPFATPDLVERPGPFIDWQLRVVDLNARLCVAAMRRAGLATPLLPDEARGANCKLVDTLTLSKLSASRIATEKTRCNIAARLYMWERHVVQPAAKRLFNEPVTEIMHFGSFSCRTISGSHRMSEHASANAFDIAGFKLKSGKIISLRKHWQGASAEATFLREARDGACDYFNLVLSPDYNQAHADHFHVDMGRWSRCR